jgi:F-type H+-transporting ATPase subunit b
MAALGVNLGYLIFQILNFTFLAIVLYAVAYKGIVNMLEKRKQRIAQAEEDARVAAEARANAEAEAKSILAKAQAEAAVKVREATERAESASRDVTVAAEAEAAKAKEAALADAALERDNILAGLRGQVAALAMAATNKLVGDALDEKRQHVLIDEFFSGVKAGKVVVLEGAELKGASAEITSALPLTDTEKDWVRKDIVAKAGSQTVTFRVDPAIMGGLIIKVGDKVVDGSVAGQIETLRQSLV